MELAIVKRICSSVLAAPPKPIVLCIEKVGAPFHRSSGVKHCPEDDALGLKNRELLAKATGFGGQNICGTNRSQSNVPK